MMRFKSENPDGTALTAKVVNVSETGLSFTMNSDEFPEVEEVLMIEFTVPGKKQIACFASVVRIEPQDDWHPSHGETSLVRIALTFLQMPAPYKRALKESLKERVSPEDDFDEAGEMNLAQRGFRLGIATLGLVMLLQTMQIPPQRLVEMVTRIFG